MTAFQAVPTSATSTKRGLRKANARKFQASAYISWKEQCIKDWWQNKLCQRNDQITSSDNSLIE
eukprot:12216211-Karenia_brevis.AAC.1